MRDDEDRDTVHRGRSGQADEGRETVIRPVGRRWRTKEPVDEQEASDPPQTSGGDRSTVVRRAPRSSDIVLDQGLPASEAEAGPEKSGSMEGPDDDRSTVLRSPSPDLEQRQPPPVEVTDRIRLPVFRPRHGARAMAIVISIVAVAAVGAVAYTLMGKSDNGGSRPSPHPTALTALNAAVTLDPAVGMLHCPEGRARYTASVTTDGAAGTLTYRWTRPDGTQGGLSAALLAQGQRSATVTLDFTFTGDGQAGGVAVFDVMEPNRLSASAPNVAYTCP